MLENIRQKKIILCLIFPDIKTLFFGLSYNKNVHFEGTVVKIWTADFDLPPKSVICARREADGTKDTEVWQIKIPGSQMTTVPSKLLFLLNIIRLYKRRSLRHM